MQPQARSITKFRIALAVFGAVLSVAAGAQSAPVFIARDVSAFTPPIPSPARTLIADTDASELAVEGLHVRGVTPLHIIDGAYRPVRKLVQETLQSDLQLGSNTAADGADHLPASELALPHASVEPPPGHESMILDGKRVNVPLKIPGRKRDLKHLTLEQVGQLRKKDLREQGAKARAADPAKMKERERKYYEMKKQKRQQDGTTAHERTIQYRPMILAGEPVDVPLKIKGVKRNFIHLTDAQRADVRRIDERERYWMKKAKRTPQTAPGEFLRLQEGQQSRGDQLREIEQSKDSHMPLHASPETNQLAALRQHEEHSAASSTPPPSSVSTQPHIGSFRAPRDVLGADTGTSPMPHNIQPASPPSPAQVSSSNAAASSLPAPTSPRKLDWLEQDRPIYSPPPSPSHLAWPTYRDAFW